MPVVVLALEEPIPAHPEVQQRATEKARRNTRTAPRFERDEINVRFSLFRNLFLQPASVSCASSPARTDKQMPGFAHTSFRSEKRQLVLGTVLGHGTASPSTVLLILAESEAIRWNTDGDQSISLFRLPPRWGVAQLMPIHR